MHPCFPPATCARAGPQSTIGGDDAEIAPDREFSSLVEDLKLRNPCTASMPSPVTREEALAMWFPWPCVALRKKGRALIEPVTPAGDGEEEKIRNHRLKRWAPNTDPADIATYIPAPASFVSIWRERFAAWQAGLLSNQMEPKPDSTWRPAIHTLRVSTVSHAVVLTRDCYSGILFPHYIVPGTRSPTS